MSHAPLRLATLNAGQLRQTSAVTLSHYNDEAQSFRQGTRDHDVSQNVVALLRHLPESGRHTILDLGCGPGRDLVTFRDLGHVAVGLDGAEHFLQTAREHSDCEVLQKRLLSLDLPDQSVDGIFATCFAIRGSQKLPRVLGKTLALRSLPRAASYFPSNSPRPQSRRLVTG